MTSKIIKPALLTIHSVTMLASAITGIIGTNYLMRWADGLSLLDPGGNANVVCVALLSPALALAIVAACIWHHNYYGLLFAFFTSAFAICGAIGFWTWDMLMPATLLLASAPIPPAFALWLINLESSARAV